MSFHLVSQVTVTGGFEGFETSIGERPVDEDGRLIYETILSGDVQDDGFELNNIWTVVYASGVQDAVLDSLTTTGAYGWDGSSSTHFDRWLGGGVQAVSSTLTLRNVRVAQNFAVGGGGGIYQAGGSLTLDHIVIEESRDGW